MIARRATIQRLSALTSLLFLGRTSSAFAGAAGEEASRWINRIDELSAVLRQQTVSVEDWRTGMHALFDRVALQDIFDAIDFDRLAGATKFAEIGVATAAIRFADGTERRLRFHPKLFAVDRGRSIIPHGHANMVSAHLTLRGRFLLRQYDQLNRDPTSLIVRPAKETVIGPGDLSSIGCEDDNVHWFIAQEPAHTFDVIVTGLDPNHGHRFEIFNLDMDRAVDIGEGRLRAPRIGVEEALAKYG